MLYEHNLLSNFGNRRLKRYLDNNKKKYLKIDMQVKVPSIGISLSGFWIESKWHLIVKELRSAIVTLSIPGEIPYTTVIKRFYSSGYCFLNVFSIHR